MKLHVFSDLHFDARSGGWIPELAPGADAVLCAGDVCQGLPEAFAFLRTFIPKPTPIITVAGNHSFYRRVMDEEWKVGREAAREHDITLLENETAVIGGARFVGATLWTDYELYGDTTAGMAAAGRGLNDHRVIHVRPGHRWFTTNDALALHRGTLAAFDRALAEPFDGPTVVLTHHCPHPRSVPDRYRGDPLNAAFASDLEWLIRRHQPFAWVHGHTHTSFDYRIGTTRILCNPHGYGRENVSGFDRQLVIEIGEPTRLRAAVEGRAGHSNE